MIRKSVNSTNIRSIGYYGTTLEVEFHNGGIYQYFGVPEHHYGYMISHAHPGTYLAAHVKNVYRYSKVG